MPPKRTSAKQQQRLTPSNILHMTVDSLRQQLKARNLSSTGNKKALAERLSTHLSTNSNAPRTRHARQREQEHSGQSSRQREDVNNGRTSSKAASNNSTATARQRERRISKERHQHHQPRGRQRSHSSTDRSSGRSGDDYHGPHSRSRSRSPIATLQRATQRHQTSSQRVRRRYRSRSASQSQLSTSSDDSSVSPAPEKHTRYKRRGEGKHKKKHHTRRRSPSTSSESSTSTSSSSSQSSSNRCRRHHHRRKHYHTHTSRKDRLPSRTKSKLQRLAVSCCPPLPEKYSTRISRGEYISFDKLTIPDKRHDKHTSKRSGKVVSDLASWLEAWNRYVGVIIALHPSRALDMLKYQTLITTAFHDYPPDACIDYDRRFRQLAAKDKTLAWGKYKEDIFVWCFSPKPSNANTGNSANSHHSFRFGKPGVFTRLGPATDSVTHTPAGAEICIRFNSARGCTKGNACKFKHVCNKKGCEGEHSASKCPSKHQPA